MVDRVDSIVIGAGVVGLACARLLAIRGHEVIVLEKNALIGEETSSRHSEVIHAGIYYPTGSLKARLCVSGKRLLYEYCVEHQVPFNRCGKMIVATAADQLDTIRAYRRQAAANGAGELRWLNAEEISTLEPEVVGVGGVYSESTGIIDSHAFMLSLQGELESHGGMIAFNTDAKRLAAVDGGVRVETEDLMLEARWLINSGGLWAAELAHQLIEDGPVAYYARGHYYAYSGKPPFSRLVYPVADAGGLGVHVTMDMAGQVKFGPDVRWIDDIDYAFDTTHLEDFVRAIRRYYPNLDTSRLHPSYTGIRPKITPPGTPASDFRIDSPAHHGVEGLINLLGIESPGMTAALAIAEQVGEIAALDLC
ncbi:MAG: NAD(P)/FAD-dependent oxidoreductase [Gammaproteobacteria bacterium]|nr:NAD(P)/FAD-dependent oxidoreductase [Gammaproteobacteria bacterium]